VASAIPDLGIGRIYNIGGYCRSMLIATGKNSQIFFFIFEYIPAVSVTNIPHYSKV
jgi:hypothetical protein